MAGETYIRRGPDGGLQWIRDRYYGDSDPEVKKPPRRHRIQVRRDFPSFRELEQLLAIYVATGEGKGAYLSAAAAAAENLDNEEPVILERLSRRHSRYSRPPPSSFSDSGDDSNNDSGHPHSKPPNKPSGGGPRPPRPSGPEVIITPLAGGRPPHGNVQLETEAIPVRPTQHHGGVEIHMERPPRPPQQYTQGHRPPSPHYSSDSDGFSDGPEYVTLPPEENDRRLEERRKQSRSAHEPRSSQARRSYSSQHRRANVVIIEQDQRPGHTDVGARRRPTAAEPQYEIRAQRRPTQNSAENIIMRERMRGGALPFVAPTRTSAFAAGVLPPGLRYSIVIPRTVVLYFFSVYHGKVLSSQRPEIYTTFQELVINDKPVADPRQLTDQWFVDKLREHYFLINRRHQSVWRDILGLKAIGFATFIRFERTVDPRDDPIGFAVTAKVPAITTSGEAVSQFTYLMRYPLKSAKMMLYNLDRLAATTHPLRDSFYAVEIKETRDTKKIYFILFVLILVSTGGGTTYAVVLADTSTGLAIATYVLTCLSLIVALVAAGQWFGLSKPDAFSFAYSLEENMMIGATNVDRIRGQALPGYRH